MAEARPPVPPYSLETAAEKARKAEDAWNTRNPQQVALAYTVDSVWRNRAEFLQGREAIVAFLTRKWQRELDYRLIKELWCCTTTASPCASPTSGTTTAATGSAATATRTGSSTQHGLMRRRIASINDAPIAAAERKFHWPLGRRPDDHPSLSDLGL